MISSLQYLGVKTQHHFVSSSYMFLDKKTVLRIWINLGLNLSWNKSEKETWRRRGEKEISLLLSSTPPPLPLRCVFPRLFFFFGGGGGGGGSCSNFRRTTRAEPLPTQDNCVVILSHLLLYRIRIPINYSDFNFLTLIAENRNFTVFIFS